MKKIIGIFFCLCFFLFMASCGYKSSTEKVPKVVLLSPTWRQTGLGLNVLFSWYATPYIPNTLQTPANSPNKNRAPEDFDIDSYTVIYAEKSKWDSPADTVRLDTTVASAVSHELYYDTDYWWMVFAMQGYAGEILEGAGGPWQFTTMKEPGEMITVTAGQFTTGDIFHSDKGWNFFDLPTHEVAITKNFQLGKYEVTNQEFVEFLNSMDVPFYEEDPNYSTDGLGWLNGHPVIKTDGHDPSTGIYYDLIDKKWKIKTGWTNTNIEPNITVPLNYAAMPAVNISWYGAVYYCDWLSRMSGYEEAYGSSSESFTSVPRAAGGFRLPTEAEWEYCARGGGGNTIYSGTNLFPANYAWFYWNSDISDGSGSRVHEVGQKLPNILGFYDMTGNVFEMCSDWWEVYCYEYPAGCPVLSTDPSGPVQTDPPVFSYKVLRGGSWASADDDDGNTFLSNVHRHSIYPENTENTVGFRIARTIP